MTPVPQAGASAQTITATRLKLAPAEILELLYHEARLLDDRLFEQWLDLYTDDACMWVPTRVDQRPEDLQVSIVSDTRFYMEYRVNRLRHPAVHSQLPPAQAVRTVSNVVVEKDQGQGTADTIVRSSFVMVESRLDVHRFFSGHYRHWVRRVGEALLIARKEVYITNADFAHSNLNLPF